MKQLLDERIIGKRIFENRKQLEMSRETYSEKPDVSAGYIGLIENGINVPTLATLIKILNAYHIGSDELLNTQHIKPVNSNSNDAINKLQDLSAQEITYIYHIVQEAISRFPK